LLIFADWQNDGLFFAGLAGYELGRFGTHGASRDKPRRAPLREV
jgi:hypothetical protein